MATSIQRIVVVLFMIDLLFVLTSAFVYNHSDPQQEIAEYVDSYNTWNQEFREIYPEANPDTNNLYLSQEIMDDKYGGSQIFKILSGGVQTPELQTSESDSGGVAGVWVFWGITLVIIIINALGAFEIFQIFYAKKNT